MMKKCITVLAFMAAFCLVFEAPAAAAKGPKLDKSKQTKSAKRAAKKARRIIHKSQFQTLASSARAGHPMLDAINEGLAAANMDYRVAYAEYFTTTDGPEFGRTVYASNRGNKQLSSHWVPGDPRRSWNGPGTFISYINDLSEGATASGLTAAQTDAAIGSAMDTWEAQTCSTIPLVDFGSYNFDFGYVQFLLGMGGSPFIFADLTTLAGYPQPSLMPSPKTAVSTFWA